MIRFHDPHSPDRLAFSPDGRLLFAAQYGSSTGARWWDWAAAAVAHELPGRVVGTSPDGEFVAVAGAGARCDVVRGPAGVPVGGFDRPTYGGWVAVAPGGAEAVVAGLSFLHPFALPDGTARPRKKARFSLEVRYSPGGRWVFGSVGATAAFFDRARGLDPTAVPAADRHWGLAVAPDDRTAAVVARTVRVVVLFDLADRAEVGRLTGHRGHVHAVTFGPDGRRVLTGSGDGTARVWDAATGECLRAFDWKLGAVRRVAWSPDGTTCAALGERGEVVVWDLD